MMDFIYIFYASDRMYAYYCSRFHSVFFTNDYASYISKGKKFDSKTYIQIKDLTSGSWPCVHVGSWASRFW
jgi:hypothetical protein